MANALLTPTMVTREALRVLHQKLTFVGSITREYDSSFGKSGAKIGDTLKIRLPNQYVVRNGSVMQANDTTETSVDLKVQSEKGVDLNFSDADLALSLDDFSDRILEPAMSVLAANIEADALSMALDVHQQVNNQGQAAVFAKFLLGRKMLVDALAPPDKRQVVLNTQDNVDMVDSLKGLFNEQTNIAKQNREGYLGRTAGFDFAENTLLSAFTPGSRNGSYTTDTTSSQLPSSSTAVTSLTVAGGLGTMKKGDIFTIANVYRCHPETKVSTGVLHQFVVTADYAGGNGSISFGPGIYTSGPRQNVVISSTASNAAMTFAGTASTAHGISLAYQKGAFAFATADLVLPKGVDMAARVVSDGISMRLTRQFDIVNGKFPARLDVLYGFKTLRPQLAVRIANN
jgi:hypothetical protein